MGFLWAGVGAVSGPLITGWLMEDRIFGPAGYFLLLVVLLAALALYALYRNTVRPSVSVEEAGNVAPMWPASTPMAVEIAQEFTIDTETEEQNPS